MPHATILIIDDEGKFRNPCYLNLLATYLWYQHQPEARGQASIVGRAIRELEGNIDV